MASEMPQLAIVAVELDAKPVEVHAEEAKSVQDNIKPVQHGAEPVGKEADDAKPVRDVAEPVDKQADDAKPVQDDAEPVDKEADHPKTVQDDAKPAEDAKPVHDDAKTAEEDDAKAAEEDDAKTVEEDDAKAVEEDDAKTVEEDAKCTKPDKKRKNSNEGSAAQKKSKKTRRAWVIDGACVSKLDITCFDLQMSDPFQQLKNTYFTPQTTLQTVVINYKQIGHKKKNMTFCFDEEGVYTRNKNVLMSTICRDIWPEDESNPFSHSAFGPYVMFYSGSTSGAPCSDMPPVATIDDFIECLCESNE